MLLTPAPPAPPAPPQCFGSSSVPLMALIRVPRVSRAPSDLQFELKVEDCLLHGDSPRLVSLVQDEGLTNSTLTRLDQLVTKDLCGSAFSRVLVVLKSLGILSQNRNDLQALISQGLTAKVLLWFETLRNLLASELQRSSTPSASLTEEFFDYFLLLGQASLPVSQLSVVLLQLAQFTLETQIHFPLRLEAIRTFNSILEGLSREQRRLIQNDQNQIQILSQVAASVLTVGDYELQVSLSEALCRLTPRRLREQRANQWFSSRDLSSTFCDIRDADFEVDCRCFLNFVNSYHGDQQRVYTFRCLRAFLDCTQLFRPKDDKLDEFWIDFNMGSGCVSFFINEPQGFLWGSIHLLKEEVEHYTLRVKHDETVLKVWLNTPIMHHNSRGQMVELIFQRDLHRQLEEAARRVFMVTEQSSPCLADEGGTTQASPSANTHSTRSYSRKKPHKSQLKILPLSSPSSEEESSVSKPALRSKAEILFDQVIQSTPKQQRVPEGAGFQLSEEQTEEFGGSSSPSKQGAFRKREAPESGYLSDPAEGTSVQRRRVETRSEGEESNSVLKECSPEGAGLSVEEVWSTVEREEAVSDLEAEPESTLKSDIMSAMKTFKAHLHQHFTDHWQKFEAEILLSLKDCQQHVCSLLTAIHQHRLVLLQRFESGITDQLSQLEESSAQLNSINTQIRHFFQSEMQRLSSFCEEHQQRLKSLEEGELEAGHPSNQ
ncbi:synaptonemal complex protein 2-like [Parambassis ranga]|uniref:Synaptonemal complex protein 2-like n=1 Tax=Parambassis ranga TaxID=210632 RepID=A0A6P7KI69_9TELE|nr:synaptonemal complex protein 2-like [Parambassis ranga]